MITMLISKHIHPKMAMDSLLNISTMIPSLPFFVLVRRINICYAETHLSQSQQTKQILTRTCM